MKKQYPGRSAKDPKIALPRFITNRFYEGGFIFVLAIASFIFLSLLTYQTSDPGWFASHASRTVNNAGGRVGAYVADGFYHLFGYLAYLLPACFTYIASMILIEHRALRDAHRPILILRTVGLLAFVISGCGLLALQVTSGSHAHILQSGGTLGQTIALSFSRALNPQGTTLLLLALFFIGITWLTGLSWMRLIEYIGAYSWRYARFLRRATQEMIKFSQNTAQFIRKAYQAYQMRPKKVVLPRTPTVRTKPTLIDVQQERSIPKLPVVAPPVHIEKPKPTEVTAYKNTMISSELPSLNLLEKGAPTAPMGGYLHQELETLSRDVEQHLLDFGIQVDVVAVHPGPVITRFELQLAAGVKVSRLTALVKDLARSLSVTSVRVVEIIPGKTVVGLELPNPNRAMVCLSDVLSTEVYQQAHSPLSLALGVDIAGHPMIVDLAKMPHLLVAGTTGSGKSVGINAMILSLLFKAGPDEVRLILIDPKMLELSVYDGIPHLLTPVVTDMKEAASALRWCVAEMERRYRLMATVGVRNLAGFNTKITEAIEAGQPIMDPLWKPTDGMELEPSPLTALPYIVVVIDELADMMMVVGKKVEQLIARIAQKARAAGIHLILATQRPSVDVLTGLIKSNIPTRISFQVSSKIDSRTILDQQGAEQLLGHGDMLFLAPGTGAPLRVHGAFVDDREVHRIADDWRARGEPQYIDEITQAANDGESGFGEDSGATEESDALYDQAVEFVIQTRKASISAVQRRFKIGYNRAARLVEEMERTGLVGPLEGGARDVLVPAEGGE